MVMSVVYYWLLLLLVVCVEYDLIGNTRVELTEMAKSQWDWSRIEPHN